MILIYTGFVYNVVLKLLKPPNLLIPQQKSLKQSKNKQANKTIQTNKKQLLNIHRMQKYA